jgi:hypothetical protein
MDDNADSNGDDDTPSSSKGKKRHVADKDNGHVHLAYNPSYSACFFSRNNIFLS